MNISDVNKIKDSLEEKASKGFGYFMKNVVMLVLIVIFMIILTNPDFITNPKEFLGDLNVDSLWSIFILFLSAVGFYQLYVSIQKQNKQDIKKEIINNYRTEFKREKEEEIKKHADAVQKRFEIGPYISNELKSLLIKLGADRAAIVEMHNGTNNASGLPFIYGDMAYEEISPNVGFAQDEFKNFNLAKLPFVATHYKDSSWIGSVDTIEKEDPYFAAKLRTVGVSYGAMVILEGINGPLGFLTLFFKDDEKHPSKAKIIAEVNHSCQILSTLLDKAKDDMD